MDSKEYCDENRLYVTHINECIQRMRERDKTYSAGQVSDGHHTFDELYDHRAKLFAALVRAYPSRAWKSKKHFDDENDPMYEDMFIVCLETPAGPVSYHYDIDPYWDMYQCAELPNAPHPYDGATPAQEVERLTSLTSSSNQLVLKLRNEFTEACDEHLREEYSRDLGNAFSTELWMDPYLRQSKDSDAVIVFRFPGATRGHIKVNPYTCQITEVKFYQEVAIAEGIGCYKESVLALEQEFTGHYFDGDSGLLVRALLSDGDYSYMDSTLRAKYIAGLGKLADMLNNPIDRGAL